VTESRSAASAGRSRHGEQSDAWVSVGGRFTLGLIAMDLLVGQASLVSMCNGCFPGVREKQLCR
jgi:hypothetical protein